MRKELDDLKNSHKHKIAMVLSLRSELEAIRKETAYIEEAELTSLNRRSVILENSQMMGAMHETKRSIN